MDGLILNAGPLISKLFHLLIFIVCIVYARKLKEPRLYIVSISYFALIILTIISAYAYTKPLAITTHLFSHYKVLANKDQLAQLLVTQGLSTIASLGILVGLWQSLKSLHCKLREKTPSQI